MSVDSILTQLSNETTTSTDTSSSSSTSSLLDSDTFMTLLLTEIQYQDPLDPMDGTEFVGQLAELSQLEQMTSISSSMDDMVDAVNTSTSTSALNYLGMEVEAEGDSVTVEDGEATSVTFTLGDDAEAVYANVYDSDGDIIDTTLLGSLEAGEYSYQWDGTDYDGNTLEDGDYSIAFYAVDADGDTVDVTTEVAGTVTAVEQTDSGVVLTLDDARTVYMADVTRVVNG